MLLLTANTTGLWGISRLDLFAKTVVIEAHQHNVSLVTWRSGMQLDVPVKVSAPTFSVDQKTST